MILPTISIEQNNVIQELELGNNVIIDSVIEKDSGYEYKYLGMDKVLTLLNKKYYKYYNKIK